LSPLVAGQAACLGGHDRRRRRGRPPQGACDSPPELTIEGGVLRLELQRAGSPNGTISGCYYLAASVRASDGGFQARVADVPIAGGGTIKELVIDVAASLLERDGSLFPNMCIECVQPAGAVDIDRFSIGGVALRARFGMEHLALAIAREDGQGTELRFVRLTP
jgi:hypothetical protein